MTDQETLQGTVEHITFFNPDSGWTVARLRVADQPAAVSVVGTTAGLVVGQQLILHGHWEHHSRWGRQFRFLDYEPVRPTTTEALADYLGSGFIKGIRRKLAARIVAHFGPQTLDILDNHPERLVEGSIRGMLPKNRLGRQIFRKLKVYAGPDHPHSAQKPEEITLQYRKVEA